MTPEQHAEARRLARCRTMLAVVEAKVASLPDGHAQPPALQRKLRVVKDKLASQEREHEAGR